MIEWLEQLDRSIVLGINAQHTPLLDEIMWFISGRLTWIPLYIWLSYLSIRAFGFPKAVWFILLTGITIGIADLASVHLIKDVVQRYRPSHNTLLVHRLHFYEIRTGEYYQGGQYGFVSSHATNFFSLAIFAGLGLKARYKWLMPLLLGIAVVICISRMYLAAHYLSDLIGGALLGSTVAWIFHRFVWIPIFNKTKTA